MKNKYIIEFEYSDKSGDYFQVVYLTLAEVDRLQKFFEALEREYIIEPKEGMGESRFISPWSEEIVLDFEQLKQNYTEGYLIDAGRECGIEL